MAKRYHINPFPWFNFFARRENLADGKWKVKVRERQPQEYQKIFSIRQKRLDIRKLTKISEQKPLNISSDILRHCSTDLTGYFSTWKFENEKKFGLFCVDLSYNDFLSFANFKTKTKWPKNTFFGVEPFFKKFLDF